MAKRKPSQRTLANLRADFLAKREAILKKKVNSLQGKLFEKVFDQYLLALEQSDGKLVSSNRNVDMTKGLDRIYKLFQQQDNVPVVQNFITDMNGIHDLNVKYFENISKEGVRASKDKVKAAMNKQLGLEENGNVKQGGFTDKFLRDESTLKKIKKLTNKALTKGQSFQDFRQDLKKFITGGAEGQGALQQYYRNYAYDTYQKVDRLQGQAFGKALGMRYFIYQGGLIKTSRPFCVHYNGRIVDSIAFSQLTKDSLPEDQQNGIPDDWTPLTDLGGYGCRHSIDWITDDTAQRNQEKFNQKANERKQAFNK